MSKSDKLKEFINSFASFIDEIEDEYKTEIKGLNGEIQNLKEIITESQKSIETKIVEQEKRDEKMFEWLQKIFSNTDKNFAELQKENRHLRAEIESKNLDIINLEKEVSKIKHNNQELSKSIELNNEKIEQLNTQIQSKQNSINTLETDKKQLEDYYNKCQQNYNDLKISLTQQQSNLETYKEVFENKKLLNLLNSILANPALEIYRETKGIIDSSPQSLFNLISNLTTPKVFVSSYYDDLTEYKKTHQSEMSKEEIEFYKAINDYFGNDVILIPEKNKIDRFDKAKHRGINRDGKITLKGDNNAIILIPADTTNNDKIKVSVE